VIRPIGNPDFTYRVHAHLDVESRTQLGQPFSHFTFSPRILRLSRDHGWRLWLGRRDNGDRGLAESITVAWPGWVVLGPGAVTRVCGACEAAPDAAGPLDPLGPPETLGVAVEGPAADGCGGNDDAGVAAGGLAGGPDVAPPREGLGAGELAPVEVPEGG
jgi:hypothetical protein